MRISTSTLYNTNVTQLDTLQSNLLTLQQQVSTGLRIQTPADDPAAAAQVLQLNQSAATNTQYIANINTATSSITLAEGTLQSVTALLQNVQSTAVSAGSSSLTNADRKSLASTLQADFTQLLSYANTTDSNGNYIFAGFKGNTQPFVQTPTGVQYNGDNGQSMIQVNPNLQVPASDSGASIFMNIKNGSGTFVAGPASIGSNVFPNATATTASVASPISFSSSPATFTVDGTAVTVNTDVTVPGNGSGAGTLAAAIQAALPAGYTVSAAAGGGLQITNSGSATPVAITNITDPLGGLGPAVNNGNGVISPISPANPPPTQAQMGNSYQIAFTVTGAGPSAVTTYSVTGTDANGVALSGASLPVPSTGLPYTSGNSISFNGVQFSISGAPANGDTLTVKPSTNESVFTTISNLIKTLNTPVTAGNPTTGLDPTQAALTAGLSHAQDSLNNALNSVLTAQSSQGARLNQLTSLTTDSNNLDTQYQTTIATLQNVDMNAAISNLTQEKTMLSAAQQSFVQIESLSMFTYMR